MKIKICGLTKESEAEYLNEAKADYAGFVIWEKSKRFVTVEKARNIGRKLDPYITKVAVTVEPCVELVKEINESGFGILQVHGPLNEETLIHTEIPVWVAVNVSDELQASQKLEYVYSLPPDLRDKIHGIVIDAPVYGSGQTFNWSKSKRLKKAGAQSPPDLEIADGGESIANSLSLLNRIITEKEFVLAGGLNEANVAEGIRLFNPDIVDVSSSVEGSDGKDRSKILAFANAARR